MTIIAVYGSSMVKPHEADYIAAYDLGKTLAKANYTVMSGGYAGVMEAISRGAAAEGGHVIGVTSQTIENYREEEIKPNQWLTEEIRYESLHERVMHLVQKAEAYVIMPGGLGTLHEMITVWEMVRVGDLPKRPIICYGQFWADMLSGLRYSRYIHLHLWELLHFAESEQDVLDTLAKHFSSVQESDNKS